MRIGVQLDGSKRLAVAPLLDRARDLEARGFASVWIPHVFGFDAMMAAALVGQATTRIEVGTAVVPTQPRHPSALAQQALTASAACDGRFTLGIGLSHPAIVEGMLGLSYDRPAAHMREVLGVLEPLLRGEPASWEGEQFRVNLALGAPEKTPVPVLLGALGERMLELAGREADGTILWATGPRAIEAHVAPKLRAAARAAGRSAPRIVAGIHVALTRDLRAARGMVSDMVSLYGQMPSYRRMLDREGTENPDQLALIGDEVTIQAGIRRLTGVGVTDLQACVLPLGAETRDRTLDFLQSLAEEPAPQPSSGR